MSRYLVLWSANQAAWPKEPKVALAVLEAARNAVAQMRDAGAITEVGWLSAQRGYALFECSSKDQLLGMIHGFYPYYQQEVQEVVPWEHGLEALLATARKQAAG